MRKYILGLSGLLLIFSGLIFSSWKKSSSAGNQQSFHSSFSVQEAYLDYAREIYKQAKLHQAGLAFPVFEKALTGYYNLKKSGKTSDRSLLTIADFDQLSTRKRLYLIDLDAQKIVLNTWVAHGQRSGADEAVKFSNTNDSFSSSLGFYVTGEAYTGSHGKSLRLDGLDSGYNDNARLRSIVIHGAPYVSAETISALGRLGRSQGCPAVAPELCDQVINALGDKSVLFINKSDKDYASPYLDEHAAAVYAQASASHNVDQN